MAAYTLDIVVATNEDWKDSLSFITGEPASEVNLTGAAFEMHIRKSADDPTTILLLSTDVANGRLVIASPATDGVLSFNVADDVMAGPPPGEYVHDLIMTVSGVVRRIAEGKVTIVQGVTR